MNNDAAAGMYLVAGILLLSFAILIWEQRGINQFFGQFKSVRKYRLVRGVVIRGK